MNLDAIGLENLPNCHFRRIKITQVNDRLFIAGEAIVFDDEEGYWSSSELLNRYLLVRISIHVGTPSEDTIFDFVKLREIQKNTSIPFAFEVATVLPTANYYVSSRVELDVEKLKQDYNEHDFNFGDEIQQWYRGPMFVEHVWRDGEPNNVYYTFNKGLEDYLGTIHSHQTSDMQGSRHRSKPHASLQRNPVNQTSPKFSYLEQQSFNSPSTTPTDVEANPNVAKTELFHVRKLSTPLLYESSFFLFYHLEGLCLDSNDSALEFYKTNPYLFKDFDDIVTVNRIRVYKFEFNSEELLISFDPNNGGYINQLSLTHAIEGPTFSSQNELKTFQIRHHFTKTQDRFDYRIEIDYTNNLITYIKQSIQKLINHLNHLESYENNIYWEQDGQLLRSQSFVNLNVARGFDVSYDKINDVYNYNMNNEEPQRQKEAFWIEIPALYRQLESLVSPDPVDEKNATSLFNLINPVTATKQTMKEATEAIKNLINVCSSKYDINLGFSSKPLNAAAVTSNFRTHTLFTYPGHWDQITNSYPRIDFEDPQVYGLQPTTIEPDQYNDNENIFYPIGEITDTNFTPYEQPTFDAQDYLGKTNQPSPGGPYIFEGGFDLIGPGMEKEYNFSLTSIDRVSTDSVIDNYDPANFKENIGKILDSEISRNYSVDNFDAIDYLDLFDLPEEATFYFNENLKSTISQKGFDLNNSIDDFIFSGPNPPLNKEVFGLQTQDYVVGGAASQALTQTLSSVSSEDVREFLGNLTLFQFVEGEIPVEIINKDEFQSPEQGSAPGITEQIGLNFQRSLTRRMFDIAPKDNTFLQIKDKILDSIISSTGQEPSDEEVESLTAFVYQSAMNFPIMQYVDEISEFGFNIEYVYGNEDNGIKIFKLETQSGKIIYGIIGNE